MNCQAAFPKATPRTDAEDAQPSCVMGNVTESRNGSRADRSPMNARTGLVPDWLERQHAITRPDRVMTITEYDERVTAALSPLAGSLYLICRRLLLDRCGPPAEGVAEELTVTARELADRLGLTNHTQVVRLLAAQSWFMNRLEGAAPIRQASGEVVGRGPSRWRVFGLPPLLPVDQAAVHHFLKTRIRPGNSDDAIAAVQDLSAQAANGWAALRATVFSAAPTLSPGRSPLTRQPLSLLQISLQAAELSPQRAPLDLIQATQTLRASLRGQRTEVPHYLIDHWLPELGATQFWLLLQMWRTCQAQGESNASLALSESAERLGLSTRTLRRLTQEIDTFSESFAAFSNAILVRGNQVEFRGVLYRPETAPLAPLHERDILSTTAQNAPSVEPNGQNALSVGVPEGQKAPSVAVPGGQNAPSVEPSADNLHHRYDPVNPGRFATATRPKGASLDNLHLEEKSLNKDSNTSMDESWEHYWTSMQSHGKLKRNRKVREQASRHLALWVGAVLEQMTRGMENPITLAVDGFNPEASQHTVPYSCLELAHRGPTFTTQVLAAMAWPDLDWPADPDRDRCIQGLRRIGMRAFKESVPQFATHTLSQLGLLKLAEYTCAQLQGVEVKADNDAPDQPGNDNVELEPHQLAQDVLWQKVLHHLQMELPAAPYDSWMAPTHLLDVTDQVYLIAAPTQYAADWLERRMAGAIRRVLSKVSGVKDCRVAFRVKPPG